MADSDFWHELADKFRALDPTQCLRLRWVAFPSERRWEPEVIATGDACVSIKAQFEALATRAGLKLTSPSIAGSGLLGWLEALQQFGGNDRPSEGIRTGEDGITRKFIGGTILRPCEVAADLCNALEIRALESAEDPYTAVLESMAAMPSGESRNRLSDEARNRIRRAHIESEKFRWESESLIESQRLDGHAATLERNKGNLQAARWVLNELRAEYSIFPEDAYRDYMKSEIEAAANSLELYATQRRMLEFEYYYPETSQAVPTQPPQQTDAGPTPEPLKETQSTKQDFRAVDLGISTREDRLQRFVATEKITIADVRRAARVFKANMQQWRHGELSDDSAMSIRIENVLSGKTPVVRQGKNEG